MTSETASWIVVSLAFLAVALFIHAIAQAWTRRNDIRHRFGTVSVHAYPAASPTRRRAATRLTPARLGVKPAQQRLMRTELIRAGYFSQDSVVVYTIAKWTVPVVLPLAGGLVLLSPAFARVDRVAAMLAGLLLIVIGFYLPAAFLKRRQRLMQDRYRVVFPEFLDMLVVCVNAGLSLDAALNRVAQEIGPDNPEFQANLTLMTSEMRAGRSSADALRDCAARLGLREATSLATLLQQSIELGTDVASSLVTFSDEMRDKRMSRAEEKAAALPPKLTLPLGLFIFPVVLIVVLVPVALRLMKVGAL